MVKGVFFDMGGVLTSSTHIDAINWIAGRMSMNDTTRNNLLEDFKARFKSAKNSNFKTVSQVIQSSLDMHRKGFNALEMYKQYIFEEVAIKPGVTELMEKLKAMNLKLGIISNTDNALAKLTLEKFGLDKTFDVVLTAEAADMYKTNKAIFEKAVGLMGLDAQEVLWVGNSIDDNTSAKASGMKTVLVGTEGEADYKIAKLEDLIGVL